ncbi:MAG TPA: hypothetical protein EYP56_17220, partial [Planctomycetaceae bacterium]|nr:hypothetical protein [Planctomycetaceae bacterium]
MCPIRAIEENDPSVGCEVSCRALGILFAWAAKRGLPQEALVRETWRSFDYLMDERQRITWAEYCAVLAKGAEVWDQEDLVQIGRAFVRSRWAKPFRLAAQILFSPTEVYAWL